MSFEYEWLFTGNFESDIKKALNLERIGRQANLEILAQGGMLPLQPRELKYDASRSQEDRLEIIFPRLLYQEEVFAVAEHFRKFLEAYNKVPMKINSKYAKNDLYFVLKEDDDPKFHEGYSVQCHDNFPFGYQEPFDEFHTMTKGPGEVEISKDFEIGNPTPIESYAAYLALSLKALAHGSPNPTHENFLTLVPIIRTERKKQLAEKLSKARFPDGVLLDEIRFSTEYYHDRYKIPFSKPVSKEDEKDVSEHLAKFLFSSLEEDENLKFFPINRVFVGKETDFHYSIFNVDRYERGFSAPDYGKYGKGISLDTSGTFVKPREKLKAYIQSLKTIAS